MTFKLPDFGKGLKEGVIVNWNVKAGDMVKKNDILCEIETLKAVVEIPSPHEGVINKLCRKVGEFVQVGDLLIS